MEIPTPLKDLYRHWELHTKTGNKPTHAITFADQKLMEHIFWFVRERIKIWEHKTTGHQPPHTEDPILSHYRFCNIFREFDRQTIAFHTLLNPIRHDFPLWLLNMFYCRMVASPQTVHATGLLSFDAGENTQFYERFMSSPRPRFGTPYVFPISTIMRSSTPTRELFIARYLPSVMRAVAQKISTWDKKSVHDGVRDIIPTFGFNLFFLWTEVLIDVAYQFPEHIDLFDQFPVGPGSMPTCRRIDMNKEPSILVQELALVDLDPGLTYNGQRLRLSAENWEGIGCEYRKYTNLKAGKGRKRIF